MINMCFCTPRIKTIICNECLDDEGFIRHSNHYGILIRNIDGTKRNLDEVIEDFFKAHNIGIMTKDDFNKILN